jgi:capsular exopolysaccharide synthesis family protein
VIPAGLIFTMDLFRNNVISEPDLTNLTSLPVLGHIPHYQGERSQTIINNPEDPILEAFRSLRSKMQFFLTGSTSQVILITSSMAGEGKTFNSINLAKVYSNLGKKTLLAGFDLRRPKLHTEFGKPNTNGISTYLIGKDKLEDIILSTDQKNLFVMLSGPIPPNSAELIASQKTKELIGIVRKKYDIIILDSAPIGIVSDTYPLMVEADSAIVVARLNTTIRPLLKRTLEEVSGLNLQHNSIILNGISLRKFSYRYDYRYTASRSKSKT